jgi:hypothetical protein
VNDEVCAGVKFDRLNLEDQSKMLFMKGFDLMFCCNVLIHFEGVAKRKTGDLFYNGLIPGGISFSASAPAKIPRCSRSRPGAFYFLAGRTSNSGPGAGRFHFCKGWRQIVRIFLANGFVSGQPRANRFSFILPIDSFPLSSIARIRPPDYRGGGKSLKVPAIHRKRCGKTCRRSPLYDILHFN